jgi:hypothetical protein
MNVGKLMKTVNQKLKNLMASYFVTVGGTNFHIGYDQRGTSIEMEVKNKVNYDADDDFSDDD